MVEPEIVKKTTIKNKTDRPIVHHTVRDNHLVDSVMVATSPLEVETRSSKTITTETTVSKIGDKHKSILGNVYDVLKKHEKQ